MGEVILGTVIFITLVGWIVLLGFLLDEKRRRNSIAKEDMVWARADERSILYLKVKELRTEFPLGSYEEAIDDVIAIINGRRT